MADRDCLKAIDILRSMLGKGVTDTLDQNLNSFHDGSTLDHFLDFSTKLIQLCYPKETAGKKSLVNLKFEACELLEQATVIANREKVQMHYSEKITLDINGAPLSYQLLLCCFPSFRSLPREKIIHSLPQLRQALINSSHETIESLTSINDRVTNDMCQLQFEEAEIFTNDISKKQLPKLSLKVDLIEGVLPKIRAVTTKDLQGDKLKCMICGGSHIPILCPYTNEQKDAVVKANLQPIKYLNVQFSGDPILYKVEYQPSEIQQVFQHLTSTHQLNYSKDDYTPTIVKKATSDSLSQPWNISTVHINIDDQYLRFSQPDDQKRIIFEYYLGSYLLDPICILAEQLKLITTATIDNRFFNKQIHRDDEYEAEDILNGIYNISHYCLPVGYLADKAPIEKSTDEQVMQAINMLHNQQMKMMEMMKNLNDKIDNQVMRKILDIEEKVSELLHLITVPSNTNLYIYIIEQHH